MTDSVVKTVGLVGGRGYTGAELLGLIARHPGLDLAFASSNSQAGQPIQAECPAWPDPDTRLIPLEPGGVADHEADAWILALPNGAAARWAGAIRQAHPGTVILDLSADHRFDEQWVYGLPERFRETLRQARYIANPGCYATGAQLALLPLTERLAGMPVIFGVSGHSGAGRTPSPRNDPERLKDNLMPYSLSGHMHEREISHQLGLEVRFTPHVAAFFRGISLTIAVDLDQPADADDLLTHFQGWYLDEPRVQVSKDIPEVRQAAGGHDVLIGGFNVDARDSRRLTLVAALDNLAKGAATQALQNLNLALGLDENTGIDT